MLTIGVVLAIAACASWSGWRLLQRAPSSPWRLQGILEQEARPVEIYLESLTNHPVILTKGLFVLDWSTHPEGEWWPAEQVVRISTTAALEDAYGALQQTPPDEVRQHFEAGWPTYSFVTLLGVIGKSLPMQWVICVDPTAGETVAALADCVNDQVPPKAIGLRSNVTPPELSLMIAAENEK